MDSTENSMSGKTSENAHFVLVYSCIMSNSYSDCALSDTCSIVFTCAVVFGSAGKTAKHNA